MTHFPTFPMISAIASLLAVTGTVVAEDGVMQHAALGAKVFAENCSRCHEPPDPASRDGRSWRAITLHMRMYADLSRQDQHDVLAFLRTFNTAGIGKQLGAPAR